MLGVIVATIMMFKRVKVLVSGGRGIGSAKGFDMLRECAAELGGEVGFIRDHALTLAGLKATDRLVRQVRL